MNYWRVARADFVLLGRAGLAGPLAAGELVRRQVGVDDVADEVGSFGFGFGHGDVARNRC